jgi:hypothetical protein
MASGRSDEDRGRPERDRDALQELSLAYAAAADARDGEALAALFVEGGALVVPRYPVDLRPVVTRSGPDALAQVAEMLGRYDRTFHLVADGRFAVEGDHAKGEVPCVAHHVMAAEGAEGGTAGSGPPAPAGPPGRAGTDMVWFIRYRDQYRRTASGWRFVRRELHLQWVEEHPVSVLGVPSD